MMKALLVILISVSFFNVLLAQKTVQYNSFFQGRHLHFVMQTDASANIFGHCIEYQEKNRINFKGKRVEPGDIYELEALDSNSLFSFIRLRTDINNALNLKGFYYTSKGYIGHLSLNYREADLNYEENRDIQSINDIYPLLSADFKLSKNSQPFLRDSETGLFYLNTNTNAPILRGNAASPRKTLRSEGLLFSFREKYLAFDRERSEAILYFQVLGYIPYHSVLAVYEEIDIHSTVSADSSYVYRYKAAVFRKSVEEDKSKETWINVTDESFPEDITEIIIEKLPAVNCVFDKKSLSFELNRKTNFAPALPKTAFYVPDLKERGKYQNLQLNWNGIMFQPE